MMCVPNLAYKKKICSGITRAKNSGGEGGHLSPNLSPDSKLNYLCIGDGRRSEHAHSTFLMNL